MSIEGVTRSHPVPTQPLPRALSYPMASDGCWPLRPGGTGRIGLRRPDQVDLSARIGRLEFGEAGRGEALHLGMVGHIHDAGDEVGEMVGPAGDGLVAG